ncbi:MAG: nucleotidyltransferase family protein [Acidimicrobiia bacterium]|nr:nucleotidyltransferase family protein [Acidimicrobiia bacterium]
MTRPSPPLFDLAAGRSIDDRASGLVPSAIEHRLGGQLLQLVEAGRIELTPDEQRTLIAADLATGAHHRALWQGLVSAIDALAEIGIDAFALKGVAEEARWYGRVGLRPCSDVDLLIAPNAVDRIDDVLERLWPEHPSVGEVTELVRRRQLQHVHGTWQGVTVDVHLDPLKLGLWIQQTDLVVETARRINGPDGSSVAVLAPEMALVSFLTHLNKDRFAYLGAYGDVARIATDPGIDWDFVRRFVEREGLAAPVWKSLAVVVEALDLPVEVPRVDGWRGRLWDRLWPPSSRLGGHEGRAGRRHRQAWIPALTTDRWPDVIRTTRRELLPPRSLLDLHRSGFEDHGRLRRLTIDRLGWAQSGTSNEISSANTS